MRNSRTIIGLVVLLSACASGSSGGERASRDVLTRDALIATGDTNAFDAIRTLQPRWLREGMSVYVDGALAAGGREATRDEGADFLRTLNLVSIEEMRYLDAQRASIRYGMGMGVVIEVSTAR